MSGSDPSKESVINDTSSVTLTTTELTSTNTSTDCVLNEVTADTTTPLQSSTTTTTTTPLQTSTTTTTTTPLQTSTTTTATTPLQSSTTTTATTPLQTSTTATTTTAATTTTTTAGVGGSISVGLPSHDLSTVPIINNSTNVTASRVESVSGICRLDTLPQEPSTVS